MDTYAFESRGIGLDTISQGCFVCGKKAEKTFMDNIAAFVDSREAGLGVVSMFDGKAQLDYRDKEPDWIQVKVGACSEHFEELKHLHELTREAGRKINKDMITLAINCTVPKCKWI